MSSEPTQMKPWRHYVLRLDSDGNAMSFDLHTPSHAVDSHPGTDGALDVKQVSNWLSRLPVSSSPEDARRLCEILNIIHSTVSVKDALPKSYAYKRFNDAVSQVMIELPSVLGEARHFVEQALSSSSLPVLLKRKRLLSEIDRYRQATERLRRHVQADIPPINHKFDIWHDDAMYIAVNIKQIYNNDRKTANFGSKLSPPCMFIAAALTWTMPLTEASNGRSMTPQPHTPDAVRKALSLHPHRELLKPD